jgi:hypothetical protein
VTETLGAIGVAFGLSAAFGFGLWVVCGVLGVPGWVVGLLWIGVVVWWVIKSERW